MRSAVTMAGLALLVSACGGSGNTSAAAGTTGGGSTGLASTGGAPTGSGGTTGAQSNGGGASTGGVLDAGLPDGTACTNNLACASHVCGTSGSGNCCSIECTATNAACAATGCDSSGACIYPTQAPDGGTLPACGGTCTDGMLDAFFCDTSGNCSVSTGQAFACPNNLGCSTTFKQFGVCNTSCATDSDCASNSFCHGGACAPRVATGACIENDGCTSATCGINGTGNCCAKACAPTADPACSAGSCDPNSGACQYPDGGPCGAPTCANSKFSGAGAGTCDFAGACITTPQDCPNFFGCNATGTACNTTCTVRSDCTTGYYCNAGACVPEIALGACAENDACTSDFCGTNLTPDGQGDCCVAACAATKDPACNPVNCDFDAGGCVYPAGFACGAAVCTGNVLSFACTTAGDCAANTAPCGGNLNCNSGSTDCLSTCASDTDCVSGYWCNPSGQCIARLATGACAANDACTSQVCGAGAGTGHCCTGACGNTAATCAATDCDSTTGNCVYPDAGTACGSTLANCTSGIEQDPSVCDGLGDCPTPGMTVCSPYLCGLSTCDNSCTDDTSCIATAFCDTKDSACCSGLITGGTINVDSKKGKDTTACCGIGTNGPCQTITHAMVLIDAAQAQNVTINASVGGAGNGGDWTPSSKESYPITLGWGVELSAPGVYFYDSSGANETFDINFYSSNDTVGNASIFGSSGNNVWVGSDQNGDQTNDLSSIQVEASNTLWIANAGVNGSQNNQTNAITIAAGGSLTLGQDEQNVSSGTVDIGTYYQYGWNGIVCQTDSVSLGCTITDVNLNGTSSVDIQFQGNMDIDAEDFASISLTSNPVVGAITEGPGFGECTYEYGKPDCNDSFSWPTGQAILLNGDVTMTYSNGTVQCIAGYAFLMQATGNGSPTLTMDSTTIQNTEYGIFATAGTANVTNSTIQYNYNGVQQGTDGNNISAVNLGGGGNTVVCSSDAESVNPSNVGVCVFNSTSNALTASNVAWDTSGPDLFSCTDSSFDGCVCQIASCTDGAGADGMDAVYDSTATVTTAPGATQSGLACTPPCVVFGTAYPACGSDETCCTDGPGQCNIGCTPSSYDCCD